MRMKMDLDCIRAILLEVEAAPVGYKMTIGRLHEALPAYSEDQLNYVCLALQKEGMIEAAVIRVIGMTVPGVKTVKGLTFKGSSFLDSIRTKSGLDHAKAAAQKLGSASLKLLADVLQASAAAALSSVLP